MDWANTCQRRTHDYGTSSTAQRRVEALADELTLPPGGARSPFRGRFSVVVPELSARPVCGRQRCHSLAGSETRSEGNDHSPRCFAGGMALCDPKGVGHRHRCRQRTPAGGREWCVYRYHLARSPEFDSDFPRIWIPSGREKSADRSSGRLDNQTRPADGLAPVRTPQPARG